MGTIDRVGRLARAGGHRLSMALAEFWPGLGEDNEMTEHNLSLYVAHAFIEAGFSAYMEVPSGDKAGVRVDLVLWHPDDEILVVAEAKRLYSGGKGDEMVKDVGRMVDFTHANLPKPRETFGLLLGTTWNQNIAHWWSSDLGDKPTTHESWDRLARHPALAKAQWSSMVLRGIEEDSEKEVGFQHFLYCAFKIR